MPLFILLRKMTSERDISYMPYRLTYTACKMYKSQKRFFLAQFFPKMQLFTSSTLFRSSTSNIKKPLALACNMLYSLNE